MRNFIIVFAIVILSQSSYSQQKFKKYTAFHPGKIWKDNNDIHINAHGGGILKYDGKYYWFGEHKTGGKKGNRAWYGVHCYSSDDLYNWEDEGLALKMAEDTFSYLRKGSVLERPKVIYNKKYKKFVMWFHHELWRQGYKAAMTGVAVADKPVGPYKYLTSMRPNAWQWPVNIDTASVPEDYDKFEWWSAKWKDALLKGMFIHRDFMTGQMSRDMTLFLDDDGKAYHIASSEENQTLHVRELSDDYLSFTGKYTRILIGKSNEAPAVIKRNGKYYMISSGCTGWKPNPARSAVAENIFGPWKELGNPCVGSEEEKATTFESQSTYILKVSDKPEQYIYLGDRWRPKNAIDGRYIWLPLTFENERPVIKWKAKWSLKSTNN